MTAYVKDPEALLDYGFDWSEWLAEGETITGSSWTVETGLSSSSDSFNDTATTIWLSGGEDGEDYKIVNHVVTSAGREDDRTITIKVRQR